MSDGAPSYVTTSDSTAKKGSGNNHARIWSKKEGYSHNSSFTGTMTQWWEPVEVKFQFGNDDPRYNLIGYPSFGGWGCALPIYLMAAHMRGVVEKAYAESRSDKASGNSPDLLIYTVGVDSNSTGDKREVGLMKATLDPGTWLTKKNYDKGVAVHEKYANARDFEKDLNEAFDAIYSTYEDRLISKYGDEYRDKVEALRNDILTNHSYDRYGAVLFYDSATSKIAGDGADSNGISRIISNFLGLAEFTPDEPYHGRPNAGTGNYNDGWYVAAKPKGLRVGGLANFAGVKGSKIRQGVSDGTFNTGAGIESSNLTDTAKTYFLPTISSLVVEDDVVVNIYLGNNGRILVDDSTLAVTKTANTRSGKSGSGEYQFEVEIESFYGSRKAVLIMRDEFNSKLWRRRFKTIDVMTDNRDLLLANNGTGSQPVVVNKDGDPIAKSSSAYYVYVGKNITPEYGDKLLRVFEANTESNDTYDNKAIRGGRTFYVEPGSGMAKELADTHKGHNDRTNFLEADNITHYTGDRECWIDKVVLIPVSEVDNAGDNWKWRGTDPTLRTEEENFKYYEETFGYIVSREYVVATLRAADATGNTTKTDLISDKGLDLRSSFLTTEVTFKKCTTHGGTAHGSATITLKDGEGLGFNNIGNGSWYAVTEVLNEAQVKNGIEFQQVDHVQNDKRTSYVYNADSPLNASNGVSIKNIAGIGNDFKPSLTNVGVTGNPGSPFEITANFVQNNRYTVVGSTSSCKEEAVHYFNLTPDVGDPHKIETNPGEGIQVRQGYVLDYDIEWSNTHNEPATITIKDRLDPGVDFVEAWVTDSNNRELVYCNSSGFLSVQETGCIVSYNSSNHTVTWTLPDRQAGEGGTVSLTVRVNDRVNEAWDYDEQGRIVLRSNSGDDDQMVVNMAYVDADGAAAWYTDVKKTTAEPTHVEAPAVETVMMNPRMEAVRKTDDTAVDGSNIDDTAVKIGDEITYSITWENVPYVLQRISDIMH